jgi:hypothetical protein
MYKQSLPGFKTLFNSAPWVVRGSLHYQFHYFTGSLAEREIEHIIKTQEDAFQKILSFLELEAPSEKIAYYFYPSIEIKEELMGSEWFAQAIYNDFAVHALYTEEHRVIGPHEDTHLVSLPLGLSIGFLQEGLAEYLVGHDWFGDSFIDAIHEVADDEHFAISQALLTDHQAWVDTNDTYARQYYALSALFTEYMIAIYGKEKYLELFKSLSRDKGTKDNGQQYKIILGTEYEEVFEHWKTWLDSKNIHRL